MRKKKIVIKVKVTDNSTHEIDISKYNLRAFDLCLIKYEIDMTNFEETLVSAWVETLQKLLKAIPSFS